MTWCFKYFFWLICLFLLSVRPNHCIYSHKKLKVTLTRAIVIRYRCQERKGMRVALPGLGGHLLVLCRRFSNQESDQPTEAYVLPDSGQWGSAKAWSTGFQLGRNSGRTVTLK